MKYNKHLDTVVRSPPVLAETVIGRNLHAGERFNKFDEDVWTTFTSTLTQDDFIRYPDDRSLVQCLALKHGVDAENILLFAGADEAINCVVSCFANKSSQIIVPKYHFPMYDVYAARVGASIVSLQYNKTELTSVTDKKLTNPKLIIVANPNSPVGDSPSLALFDELEQIGVPIVVDSVYCDFGSTPLLVTDKIQKNYIFVHSFSKSFGGAGARIGYVIANAKVISILNKMKPMSGISGASIKFAQWSLENLNIRDEYVNTVIQVRTLVNIMFPWNIGGNWVHIPAQYSKKLDELGVKYKSKCYLPTMTNLELIRVSASPIILTVL